MLGVWEGLSRPTCVHANQETHSEGCVTEHHFRYVLAALGRK